MDRRYRRPARVPHPVDVRAVEDEALTGARSTARMLEPFEREDEAILDQRSFADEHPARGDIVIVVTGLLVVEPADEPHIDVGVAVELDVVALPRVVTDIVLPQLGPPAIIVCELCKLGLLDIPVGWYVLIHSAVGSVMRGAPWGCRCRSRQ